jgi:hypothetical protein
MFHIKSDSAIFDNIAVLSGSGSVHRFPTACSIVFLPGPERSHGQGPTHGKRKTHAKILLV